MKTLQHLPSALLRSSSAGPLALVFVFGACGSGAEGDVYYHDLYIGPAR